MSSKLGTQFAGSGAGLPEPDNARQSLQGNTLTDEGLPCSHTESKFR
jgi:hypothetical protein